MWAVRAFVVKTLSGHSRHTHVHTVDTGIFPSCFDALRWGVRLGWVAWSCQWERCCFVFVFLSPALSLSHTHWFILLLFTLSCPCFLPLFSWQSNPNKMEFGTFAKTVELPSNAPLWTNASMLTADQGLVTEWCPCQMGETRGCTQRGALHHMTLLMNWQTSHGDKGDRQNVNILAVTKGKHSAFCSHDSS